MNPPVMFRVRRSDGFYFANGPGAHRYGWTENQFEATRWDRHRTPPEEIIKAFDWILGVKVIAEDAD